MKIETAQLIFFSPTGTTKKNAEAIASGMGLNRVTQADLTQPLEPVPVFMEQSAPQADVVILGAPVYSGRVPELAEQRIRELPAYSGTPAVVVAVYGNRHYDDSLLELGDLARERGLIPVAAAACIGEHSFATQENPIAMGRPDAADIQAAAEFGAGVSEMLKNTDSVENLKLLAVPGNRPFKDRGRRADIAPETQQDICTRCGKCVGICPARALRLGSSGLETDTEKCIICCACIKVCVANARVMKHPKILGASERLSSNYGKRREPEFFLPEM